MKSENRPVRIAAFLIAVVIGVIIGFLWSPWEEQERSGHSNSDEAWIELPEERLPSAAQV